MGNSSSRIHEDQALVLCRERKRFVKHALDRRCSLVDAHVNYVRSLKSVGLALGKFVEPDVAGASSLYTPTSVTPPTFAEKSSSRFSFSTPSRSQRVDVFDHVLPSPSPPYSGRFQTNHMMFRGPFSNKVEEKLPVPVSGTVTSSNISNTTPNRSVDQHGSFSTEAPPHVLETPPWDYFSLFHPIDDQFSTPDAKGTEVGAQNMDTIRNYRENEDIPQLEDEDEHQSSHGLDTSDDSNDEFEEPSADTLVRRFTNLNTAPEHTPPPASPALDSARSAASEADFMNDERKVTPAASPLTAASSTRSFNSDLKKTPVGEKTDRGNKVNSKDFYSSIKDIEQLFVKASEAGQEVPRMLEANKLNFHPIVPGKEGGSIASVLRACFSCGDEPRQVPDDEPAPNPVMYLTWHRTTSSHSSSSRTPVDNTNYPTDIHCMNSGSHASTLDRLYAWERKLYDEVKTSEMVRSAYDAKCELLKHLESKGTANTKIDKTRALVKDLHSRIGVAICRIDTISKKIEEIRDKELQPQLEELIEGLTRMWEVMLECHKKQYLIISMALTNRSNRTSLQSELRRQIAVQLENHLTCLANNFVNWIGAHKSYLKAIDEWLLKCAPPQKLSVKKRKQQLPCIRNFGPPIYITCGRWLQRLDELPTKEVAESIKGLAVETSRLLPKFEEKKGPSLSESSATLLVNTNGHADEEASEDWVSGFDRFRSGLVGFLGQMSRFAEYSVEMYKDIEKAKEEAKIRHKQHLNSQS